MESPTAARTAPPLPGADTLLLWVRDDGTGIAAEDQQRIFERFGRAHPGRGQEGSGLGLAIVTAIAQAHGGVATVESEYGHGARFLIRIPLQSAGVRVDPRPGLTTGRRKRVAAIRALDEESLIFPSSLLTLGAQAGATSDSAGTGQLRSQPSPGTEAGRICRGATADSAVLT